MIGDLDWGQIARGLVSIVVLMAALVAPYENFIKRGGTIIKGAGTLILFAVAIKIMASALNDLSDMTWAQMIQGLVGLGIMLSPRRHWFILFQCEIHRKHV